MNLLISLTLDVKGLSGPLPIIRIAKAIEELSAGDLVAVFATDPGSVLDFHEWCLATGNELLDETEEDGVYRYVIRKR